MGRKEPGFFHNWIKGAQSVHGLHIDYIGGWNESGYNKTWYEDLKNALNSNGLTTKIVAGFGNKEHRSQHLAYALASPYRKA